MSTQTSLPPESEPLPPGPDQGANEPKKKKHKVGTLRRALSWLRGRKKKKSEVKQLQQQERKEQSKEAQPSSAPEVESLDNGFFPSKRTALVEDIHSQAQEGLKSLQRREKQQNKLQPQEENQSSPPQPDSPDNGFRARSQSCATESTDDAMSVRSEMIQRKGSTFRPYDSPSVSSGRQGRRRKQKRATVMGVPHHVAAELGLKSSNSTHRGIHELFPKDVQPIGKQALITGTNGIPRAEGNFVVIPTVDGNSASTPHEGAHISLAALEQTEAVLQRHIDRVYKDDSYIDFKSGPKLSPLLLRPKSLAVPGMTTHSPRSPVMCISPQATYMSKIIPNAVLPPMVDVVALSHTSVRTLSRCSLATASPASVRGSLHRGRGQSFSSDTWSRSQSTETIVSDSSTISSHGGVQESSEKYESRLSTGRASPALSTGTQEGSDSASLCSAQSSIRSVSLRKSKKAPTPPKRTYSLQQQREMGLPPRPERKPTSKSSGARDQWVLKTEAAMLDNEVFSQSMYSTKLSSPSRSDRTLSPSSGYSSQSGTPTLPPKTILESSESPGSRRKTPPKPERTSLRSKEGSSVSTNSSNEATSPILVSPAMAGTSMGDQERLDLIPPHPNVLAPLCPPPSKISRLVKTPSGTPDASPPPSHHPTPPPIRKSDSEGQSMLISKKTSKQREILWPPPPPDVPDLQDTSMADFPPPEEELLMPPPPSLDPGSDSILNSEQICNVSHKEEEKSSSGPSQLPISIATEAQSAALPCHASSTHSIEPTTVSVLHSANPSTLPTTVPAPPSTDALSALVTPLTQPIPATIPTEPASASVPPLTETTPASVPPLTETTPASVPPLTETTPASVPPLTETASVPPLAETTPASVPPLAETTPASVPPLAVTTPASVPPLAETTPASVPPLAETTPASVPPLAETTPASVPPLAETTPASVPPLTKTTPVPPLSETTPAPPLSETTPAPPLSETTPAPPLSETTPTPPLTEITPAPPLTETTPAPPLTETTPAPPLTETTPAPPLTETTPAPPLTETTPAPPLTETTPAPPLTETTPATVPPLAEATPTLLGVPATTEVSHEPLVQSVTYKSHAVATPLVLNCATTTVNTTGSDVAKESSVVTVDPTISTTASRSTVSPFAPVPLSQSTRSSIPLVPGSPRPKPSTWKPVSAPSKKLAAPSQPVAATPKEDANLPIVTPSLLQMVRLRSVQVRGPQEDNNQFSGLSVPQKPIRKSLSQRSPPGFSPPAAKSNVETTKAQQKIAEPGHSPSTHKSPASAANFVFSRGAKKFVFEPPTSEEAEASLKRNLVAELKSQGIPRSPEEKPPLQRKPSKIPPPVARKPSLPKPRASTSSDTGGSNGSVCTPCDTRPAPAATGTNAAETLAGHEQQQP
ncbi:uncharacterized protein KIAA1522 [Xenopus laevis]|uniref:Uncharacterized protein KIAA1522 n=2 Tax=Xenopus laevis TaxID=8355 RepID=A0A1L8HFQ2_XENLA|nr:uncharacterized protein KIAA1522 [Xenopus laevis]OCT94924.1 hypothetical protein XELAEV_18012609mg [Xenopus laevis]